MEENDVRIGTFPYHRCDGEDFVAVGQPMLGMEMGLNRKTFCVSKDW